MDHEQSDEEMSHSNGTLLEDNDHHEITSNDDRVLLVEQVEPVEATSLETSHHCDMLPSLTDNARREPVSSSVQPISFEVLYSCPTTERFSLSHNEELYTTTNQLNRHFPDDTGVNEAVEVEDEGEQDMHPDDNYDEEEMGSALGIALPNLATASFSEISRLDSVPGNDTIQLNVGADRLVPSRAGNSTIANLFLSLPTTCPNGTHRGASGTVSSVPTESGNQISQTTIGWTSPGDIVLPRENPMLLFQRGPRHSINTNTSGFDVLLVPSGLSSRLHAIQLPYSFQSSLRQGHYINYSTQNVEHSESSGTTTQEPEVNPEIFYVPTLFSLGHIMFDPWAQVAVTSLCSTLTDTSNAYTTCAQASCVRSRLSASRDTFKFTGVSIICDEFKSWVLTERRLNYQTVYSDSEHQSQRISLSVAPVQNKTNSQSESVLLEQSEGVFQENSQNDLQENSGHMTSGLIDNETQVTEQREVNNHSLLPGNESFGSPNRITIEQAYGLLRHEEMTSTITFSSRPVRHLALVLGLTQQQLLSCLGIDVTFFSEIPEDIQNEILTQQLPFISVLSYENFRHANCDRLSEISSFIIDSLAECVTPDSTGIRLIYTVGSNTNETGTVAASSDNDAIAIETQATSSHRHNSEEAITNELTNRQWRLSFQHSTEFPWQVDQLSIHLDDSMIEQLPRVLRESIIEDADSFQDPMINTESINGRSENAGFDNASFLETLDAALREDLLLTATEEDLNALPAQYVAEAVLLRTHRATTQSPSRSVRFVNNYQGTGLNQSIPQNRRGNVLSEEFRLISTAPSNDHTDGGTHQSGLQQLYNALFSAMNVRLHSQSSQTAARSNTRTSNATNTIIPISSNISTQNSNRSLGMSLRRTGVSLPGYYSNSSIASQRLIYEALDQILGDVDPAFLSLGPTRNRYQSRDTRSHRNGILESFSRSDNFSNIIQNSCQHGSQEKCHTHLNGRTTQDLLCCNRCSSPFDIPLNPMGIVVICRLLFLKRQVYRRDMHRLFLSMTASHPSTRQGLLQVLLVIIWNAVTDIQAALHLPRASESFLSLGFPPERLYSSTTLTTSLLFDSHPEAAASIAGYRALEHIRSLLEVIPNLSEFFATSMPHPAYVTFWNSKSDSSPALASNDNIKTDTTLVNEGDIKHNESLSHFFTFNKDLSSKTHYANVPEESHNSEINFSATKERIETFSMYEYPINILLTLTSSRLFHTSSNHMVHLLSAIDFLLCASQKNENDVQQLSTSNVQEETSEENENNFTNENELDENITQDKIVSQNVSIKTTEGNRTHDLSLQQKIINVVSRDAALTLCRLFTGIPPNTKACKDHATFFNLYYASTSHQSPLPILSRIVALFYWSPKHHHDIHQLFVSSLKSLLHYIICHLQKLKEHTSTLVKLEALSKENKNIDPTFDFLLPENIRTPLDTSLNLLLRLTVSLQDVFWSNPLALNPQPHEKNKEENSGSNSNNETKRENTTEFEEEVEMKSPKMSQKNSSNPLEKEEEEECIREDKKSLVMLRDLFNHVGMCELWKITDELLTEIELACPFLLNKFTETFHYKNKTVSSSSSSGIPLSDVFVNESRLILPLIVNQLLPLINSYLIVAQVTIAADLNFRASEVPRVVTQFSGTKCETQLQQKFSEKFSNYLCNSDKTYTKQHCEMLMFCERHRKLINLLVQHSPGILNGSFQPLVALAALCLTFENKRQYFRHSLKQLRETTRYDPIRLHVRRSMVFMDSFHQLRLRNGEEMKGKLIVHFQGEEGVDAGGLVREWYGILSKEMFNPDYALFRREGTKSEFNHPNPLSHVNPDHLCFFKFVGRVIGKAIYDGHHLASYFTRSFYKQMLGRKSSPSDAECIDPELYKSLQMLLSHNIADLGLDLHFSTDIDEFGQNKIIDLLPNGQRIPVTEENKQEYVKLLCEHKISHGIRTQTESFLEGFHELIPPKFLTIFDDKELELLISGISFVDIEDLRANTVYHGYQATSPQIYWFWNLLEEMDQNTLATFLQFVTGTSRVPLGGFRELMGVCGPQLFSIHRDYDETRLPSAHTCFNQLDLPQYSSMEILKEKILKAIFEGSEGFGFA
ncbi:uncharacterized protein LOC128883722 [Hylaeus volcanicus]|uniref:uncharacterized protein LOC128883722 n=1 Tax=Hylaeus volcanicus TaxID=313075 RepID=UPI0023B7F605|nr:uncharacterized protein LOC128883722 [Hylaeus volcanicus]